MGQVPTYASVRAGGSRAMFYGDYTDCASEPLFPFGHGLSYTTFDYSDLSLRGGSTTEPVVVGATVTNPGSRAGTEVVQLYATDLVASVARPERQLVGWARMEMAAGEARRVSFAVDPTRLAFFDEDMRFVVEPGQFRFGMGRSSSDIHL